MLQEALYKLNGNDLPGAARCANDALRQLETIVKFAPPLGMPVEPAQQAEESHGTTDPHNDRTAQGEVAQ